MTELIVGGGLFLGCATRALLPFFRKQAEAADKGIAVKWEKRYIWTIIFSFVGAFVETMMIVPTIQMLPVYTLPIAFAVAFRVGWSNQDILNTIVK